MVEIRITYETLFDLLRREKNREELQNLEKDFYEQVDAYLREKEVVVNRKEDSSFFSNDHEKLKVQFLNIRRLIKELYERREKKIINLAMIKARTGSDIMDMSNLLYSEKEFFEEQVRLFAKYKREILDKIINPRDGLKEKKESLEQNKKELAEDALPDEPMPDIHFKKQAPQAPIEDASRKKIKIMEYLPKFVGRQGEILGPFEKDSIVELDHQIADLLLKKGRAEVC